MARLEACRTGLGELDPGERAEVLGAVRAALDANGLNLNWTRLRAQLARIGLQRGAAVRPEAPRLDIVF